MTVSMNADQVVESIQLAAGIGAFLGVVILGLLIWLMVRPKRNKNRQAPRPEADEQDMLDMDEVLNVLERMEQRLRVVERTVIEQDEAPRIGARQEQDLLEAGDEGSQVRRDK